MSQYFSKMGRLLMAGFILTSCIGCDQFTKYMATQSLKDSSTQSFLNDTVRLQYALNPGGFLSIGSSFSPELRFGFFIGLNSLVLMIVSGIIIARWNMKLSQFVLLLFFLAGGLGNLIDRVFQNGLVTDFLNIGIGPIRTGIFNVADIAVFVSGILLIITTRKTTPAENRIETA
jgi:signal peptidase II